MPDARKHSDNTERSPLVLVVEDDADIRMSLAELLADDGFEVIAVADGQKAFDYLSHRPAPDCVVLDLWMPVMDGWTLSAEILAGRLPKVPILVVTAAGAQVTYPVPARYVLRKPFDSDRLLALVRELIEKNRPSAGV
jgi:CheY-like chemotaxis protein